MHDKLREASAPSATTNQLSSKAALHAAIGHFSSFADAQEAVMALRRAGFADDTISVRQLHFQDQDDAERLAEKTGKTIVGVRAEGERAAEAWSILQNTQM